MPGKAPIVLFAALLASCAGPENLHRVDDKIWRSSQPTRYEFRKLAREQGIGEVLCLRRWHSDREEAVGLKSHLIPAHGSAEEAPEFQDLFNGRDLSGRVDVNGSPATLSVQDGTLACSGLPIAVMRSEKR